MAENLYDLLGVEKSASGDELRRAFRVLARKYHPDVNPGDTAAEDRFKKISAAYEVLSDADKRNAYDEFGEESLKGGFDPEKARAYQSWQQARSRGSAPFGGADTSDFDLGDLFGFGRARPGGATRGPDVRAVVDMDLRQAIHGGEVQFEIPGHGAVTVRIPPGADDGSTLRVTGKGAPGANGGPPGDLVLETRVRPHPVVTRDGLNMSMRVPVTLDEAYNGATIEIPTFDGNVKVQVPPRTQAGTRLRLRGKGVQRKDRRGDLFVEVDVKMPDKDDKSLAEALRQSGRAYSSPVRKEFRL